MLTFFLYFTLLHLYFFKKKLWKKIIYFHQNPLWNDNFCAFFGVSWWSILVIFFFETMYILQHFFLQKTIFLKNFFLIFFFSEEKKCYTLSFPILGGRNSTRALQSSTFQNPGGVPWCLRRRTDGGRKSLCLILDSSTFQHIPAYSSHFKPIQL